MLKRLEILHADPPKLQRSHDIDRYLSNFCAWQEKENLSWEKSPLHWDHALMLTGLDLYAIGKSGKLSNQVLGEYLRSRSPEGNTATKIEVTQPLVLRFGTRRRYV